MIENFQHYVENGLVKKTALNKDNAAALMARSYARLGYVKSQRIGKDTAPFIFEDVYEVLRAGIPGAYGAEGLQAVFARSADSVLAGRPQIPGAFCFNV